MQQRFLARALTPQETLVASNHLNQCALCRGSLNNLRSNQLHSVVDQILGEEAPANHHPSPDLLAAYVDEDLSPADRPLLEAHLSSCEFCRVTLADLQSFRTELQETPAQIYTPGESIARKGIFDSVSEFWTGLLHSLTKPIVLTGGLTAAALLIVLALLTGRFSSSLPFAGQTTAETIQDGTLTFQVQSAGHVQASTQLPSEALNVLASALFDLVRSSEPSADLTRGISSTPDSASGSPGDTKLPATDDYFSRKIFGEIVILPRGTSDPYANPNGVIIREVKPTLSWRPMAAISSTQTLTVEDCGTGQTVLRSELPGSISSFTIQAPLQRGNIYRWNVATSEEPDNTVRLLASGRFKIAPESDLQTISSSTANSSHLLKAFWLARAGLFRESEAELIQLQAANPKSATIAKALDYVLRLEGR
jgi:hypothetical protein